MWAYTAKEIGTHGVKISLDAGGVSPGPYGHTFHRASATYHPCMAKLVALLVTLFVLACGPTPAAVASPSESTHDAATSPQDAAEAPRDAVIDASAPDVAELDASSAPDITTDASTGEPDVTSDASHEAGCLTCYDSYYPCEMPGDTYVKHGHVIACPDGAESFTWPDECTAFASVGFGDTRCCPVK